MASQKDNPEGNAVESNSESRSSQWSPQSQPPQVCYPPGVMPHNGQFTGYAPVHPGHYPYVQPPAAATIYNGQGNMESPHRKGRFSSPCRCFLTFVLVFVILLIISGIIICATLLPRFPVFHVDNMSVSNFHADVNPFTAKWDAQVTVENPNTKLNLYLDRVEGFVNYNYEYDLGFTWINPMFMPSKNKTQLRVVIITGSSAQFAVPIWIAQDMGKDQKNGAVNFLMKFRVWVTLKSSSLTWFRWSLVLDVECNNLKVNFRGPSQNGTLESKHREDCHITA